MEYTITGKDETYKPKNIKFKIEGTSKVYSTFEELVDSISIGKIQKDEQITIPIQWFWEYETNTIDDKQDTIDSQTIREYRLSLRVVGKEKT